MDIVERLKNEQRFFAREQLADPIAEQTSWKSQDRGSANFVANKITTVAEGERIAVVPSNGMGCFTFLFIAVGLVLICLALAWMWIFGADYLFNTKLWILPLTGLFFIAGGLVFRLSSNVKVIFDKKAGYVWRAKKLDEKLPFTENRKMIAFKDIHAIQLLKRSVMTTGSSYDNFEINLILNDAERYYISGHGVPNNVLSDAAVLAFFVEVPLWIDV